MIEGSGQHTGPAYLCTRCEWAPELCTCQPVRLDGLYVPSRRQLRRRGDDVDREWQAERGRTALVNRIGSAKGVLNGQRQNLRRERRPS